MSPAAASTPILPLPHRIRGYGALRLTGEGEVVLELDGTGQATVLLRGDTALHFEGEAARRMPSPGELVWMAPRGTLAVRGSALEVRFSGGRVCAFATGRFDAELDGCGEVEPPRGAAVGWGLRPRTLRLEAGAVGEPGHAHPLGGAAA